MELAVIIPTLDRQDVLRRCLLAIASPAPGRNPGSVGQVQIVVSDDGSVEKTRQMLMAEFPEVHFVQGPQQGPAANRNHGAAQVSADLLIFLDDDCIPEKDLLETYRAAATQMPDVGVFEGRISALGSPRGFGDCAPVNETGGYLWSCNFAVRSSVFRELKGFDERFSFPANEDSDLYLRAKRIATVRFVPEARVFHGYETRLGERSLRHKSLSSILYLQNHTPQLTGHTAGSFLRAALRSLLILAPKLIRAGAAKHPTHLLRLILYDLRLAAILAFWKHRSSLGRLFYRPCCEGCRQMLGHIHNSSV